MNVSFLSEVKTDIEKLLNGHPICFYGYIGSFRLVSALVFVDQFMINCMISTLFCL